MALETPAPKHPELPPPAAPRVNTDKHAQD
jgi:hypothetical protein